MFVVQKCPLSQEKNDHPKRPPVTIRVSLFFDGTLNNRYNTGMRVYGQANEDQLESGSYCNDYSNVAKLESALKAKMGGYDLSNKFYIEGIGTEDGETDSIALGASQGRGDTGIIAKVERGLDKAYEFITSSVAQDIPITHIHLDSFGFSRGAAAARYFIFMAVQNQTTQLQERLQSDGYTVGTVKMRFVGLFDTVASWGLPGNHKNNTRDLNLDAVKLAEKVVQLAAAEEHRKNFRLTNIASATKAGVGKEVFLPGVHSDIGGGYVDTTDEVDWQLFDIDSFLWNSDAQNAAIDRERRWITDQGWFHDSELQENNWNEVIGTRKGIRNTYARIPLQLMAKYATQLTLSFEQTSMKYVHGIPPDLTDVYAQLEKYADAGTSQPSDWFNKITPMLRTLRHNYLHFSAYFGSQMSSNAPQFSDDDPVNGRRTRIIQDG